VVFYKPQELHHKTIPSPKVFGCFKQFQYIQNGDYKEDIKIVATFRWKKNAMLTLKASKKPNTHASGF
jgi:hypothetical protein